MNLNNIFQPKHYISKAEEPTNRLLLKKEFTIELGRLQNVPFRHVSL